MPIPLAGRFETASNEAVESWILLLVPAGALLVGGGLVAAYRAVRLQRRGRVARGEVREVVEDSGEFPVIRFVAPEKGEPVTFRSGQHTPGARVGDVVEVLYDPRHPRRAELHTASARASRFVVAGSLVVAGASLMGLGLGLYPLLRYTGRLDAEVKDACVRLVRAAHRGGLPAARAEAAPGAYLEQPFLTRTVARSRSLRFEASSIGAQNACVQAALVPSGVTVYFALRHREVGWRVERVANQDRRCARELSD